jgi:hypothetical protein
MQRLQTECAKNKRKSEIIDFIKNKIIVILKTMIHCENFSKCHSVCPEWQKWNKIK